MYCVKCGVELADSEKVCPLCRTMVFHPDIKRGEGEPPYPEFTASERHFNRFGALFIVTFIFLIPLFICLMTDLRLNGRVVWSGYVAGGLATGYAAFVLPFWFRRPNPVIFLPIAFAAAVLYLLYIDLATGGSWFLSLAFPVAGIAGLIVTAVTALCKYLRKGRLFVFGGAFIALGGYSVLVEMFIVLTVGCRFVFWSLYPLTACVLIGLMLIAIGVCKPLRRSLDKRFFI